MYISRIHIENFRNFRKLDVTLSPQAVFVGENKVGKTNLMFALRLVLDHSLGDASRELRREDFWHGLQQPMLNRQVIRIDVELAGIEEDDKLIALLADHLIQGTPSLVARLSYVFQPKATEEVNAAGVPAYEFRVFGGGRQENAVASDVRRYLPLKVLPALRDAEADLKNWRHSPLRPLIDGLEIGYERLAEAAKVINDAKGAVAELEEVGTLNRSITARMLGIAGPFQGVETNLGLLPSEPDKLLRSLQLFIDGGANRTLDEASLGTANLVYLSLLDLELRLQTTKRLRHHTFLCIEEPEAHLHPQLQRLVYRAFLNERHAQAGEARTTARSVLLTTLSPAIVSVTPLRSFVLLRETATGTTACSTAGLELPEAEVADLERYLDATRGEMLFARGVLLVEGMAEAILVPALARAIGKPLDELGISVCAINGVHFLTYVRFLDALGIPWAVVTDLDPGTRSPGDRRVARMYHQLTQTGRFPRDADIAELARLAKVKGMFVGTHTFEVDLFLSGLAGEMCLALLALDDGDEGAPTVVPWDQAPANIEALLGTIERVGKGRLAQRLAQRIPAGRCPPYIAEAIRHVELLVRTTELSRTVPIAPGGVAGEPAPTPSP